MIIFQMHHSNRSAKCFVHVAFYVMKKSFQIVLINNNANKLQSKVQIKARWIYKMKVMVFMQSLLVEDNVWLICKLYGMCTEDMCVDAFLFMQLKAKLGGERVWKKWPVSPLTLLQSPWVHSSRRYIRYREPYCSNQSTSV